MKKLNYFNNYYLQELSIFSEDGLIPNASLIFREDFGLFLKVYL